jgi:DNA-binding transcriptional LysR family regulator
MGIGRSPVYAIADAVRDGRLRVLFPAYETVEYGLYAVYPHRRYLAVKVRSFIEFLANWFGDQRDRAGFCDR